MTYLRRSFYCEHKILDAELRLYTANEPTLVTKYKMTVKSQPATLAKYSVKMPSNEISLHECCYQYTFLFSLLTFSSEHDKCMCIFNKNMQIFYRGTIKIFVADIKQNIVSC